MSEPGADLIASNYRVIYGDTDQMGVVYYANYLRFFEIGRNEWIRASGMPYGRFEEQGMMLPVADVACSYRNSALYDDLIAIDCWTEGLGRASIAFGYRIRRGDEVLATGRTKHAVLDRSSGRLKPWPRPLYEALDAYRQGLIKELP
jgi:acyl-CoA thioester hydrolase